MGERHAAASGVYGGDRRLAVGVDAARSRTVSMDERTVSVGESHAAASGVYGGDRRLAVGVGAARSRTVSWTNGRYRWARGFIGGREARRCERRLGLRRGSAVVGWRRCGSQPHGLNAGTDVVGGRETRRCERRLRKESAVVGWRVRLAAARPHGRTDVVGGRETRRCERRLRKESAVVGWRVRLAAARSHGRTDVIGGREARRYERRLREESAVVGWRRCGSQPHGLMDERTLLVGEKHAAASGVYGGERKREFLRRELGVGFGS